MHTRSPQVLWYKDIGRGDVARVGGKNASLGEMVRNLGEKGVKVPPGFATTAEAYWQYVEANGLRRVIADSLKALDAGHASRDELITRDKDARVRIAAAADYAIASPLPDPTTVSNHVFA